MDGLSDAASLRGALRFLGRLSAAAGECAEQLARTDELSARRRRREQVRPAAAETPAAPQLEAL
ncbi:MAG TPA: hypothetical protein VFB22_11190 [Candidatus Baltobacteraceae bacterium]|nr:hypothetical protein [Candidatus Baltobacteraceae bacterium]